MRLSTGQYAVRLTCGLGLLLLPAVQQKVCAWPVPQEAEIPRPAEPDCAAGSDEQPKRKTKPPLTLAAMLPDVVAPRWPSHTHLSAVQRLQPLPIATWMDGPAGFDDQSGAAAGIDAFFAAGWSRHPAPQRLPTFGNAGLRLIRVYRHVFQTSILKTGPPRA